MKLLPTFDQAEQAMRADTATPIDRLVYKCTPTLAAPIVQAEWRMRLLAALQYVENKEAAKHSARSITFMYMLAAFGLGYVLGIIIPYIGSV